MVLTSFYYFVFLFCSLIFYYLLPKKVSYVSLLLFSIGFLFIGTANWYTLFYTLAILGITYGGSLLIDKYRDEKKKKNAFFIISLVLIIGILTFLKYTNLFIVPINLFLRNKLPLFYPDAPMGVSYYSLILIGYLINVYWGVHEVTKNPLKLGLFMSYFPLLTSGPIIDYNEMKDSLFVKNKFKLHNILDGLLRILWGVFKVLIISTRLDIFVSGVYNDISNYSFFIVLIAIFGYTLQLYSNFSGTIDIALGSAKLFGIELPENFNKPFESETITEFWRRWHITLGTWLKKYIFYPIMKSEGFQKMSKTLKTKANGSFKKLPTYLSLLIVWLVIGIWHGGSYKFIVASGLLQFLCIVLEDIFGMVNKKGDIFDKMFRRLRTFVVFSFTLVFFRASSLASGLDILRQVFKMGSFSITLPGLNVADLVIVAVSLIGLFIVEYYIDNIRECLKNKSVAFKLGLILFFIIFVLVFGVYGFGFNKTDFIYGKF